MKFALAFLLFFTFSACGIQSVESQKLPDNNKFRETSSTKKQPVLVELFTSEGCSSCPPAERNLAYFQTEQPFENAEVITLALHVDYWNYLGWKDKYASPLYTQRQRVYDRKFRTGNIYTPQMVVDGTQQFVGSDLKKAKKAIKKALKVEKATFDIAQSKESLKLNIFEIPKRKEDSSVYIAIAEDGISTRVKRGENAGKTLKHVSVVRNLKGLGRVKAIEESFEMEVPIQIQADWKKENLTATIFVQGNSSRKVYGVKRVRLFAKP